MRIFSDLRFYRQLSQIFADLYEIRRSQKAIMATQVEVLALVSQVSSKLSDVSTEVQTLLNREEVPAEVVAAVQGLSDQVDAIKALTPSA